MSLMEKLRGFFTADRPQPTPKHERHRHEERLKDIQDRLYAVTAEARAQRVIAEKAARRGS